MAIPTIIPAILARTINDFQKDLQNLLNSKNLSNGWVHVDFMDNIFVPNKSITVDDLKDIDFGKLKKEAHLMVKEPLEWIKKLITQKFSRIIIHIENDISQNDINLIKKSGAEAGLAINPETPIEKLAPFIKNINIILVMGVHPGFQGQSFIPQTLDRIKRLASQGQALQPAIEVDGAVKDINAREILESGADILISGSFLIKGNPDQNLDKLIQAIS